MYILSTYIFGGMMGDVVTNKLFKTGGSVAVRIPAGWLDPAQEVALSRNPHTGRITISQAGAGQGEDFFEFLRGKQYLKDVGLEALVQRDDAPRDASWAG
jgi:virulence-associated protein VagC